MTVTSSNNGTSVFGQSVTFTATVTGGGGGGGTPTGTVTFANGGVSIGTGPLNQGSPDMATLPAPTALIDAVGTSTITAVYSGDSNFNSVASLSFSQTVTKATTATTVTLTPASSTYGQSVTFTAIVSAVSPGAGTPTGTVTFQDGGVSMGTGTVSNGTATYTTGSTTLPGGTDAITVGYNGNANFSTSSGTLSGGQTVAQAGTSTNLTSSSSSSPQFGQTVFFTATVSNTSTSVTPTGTVIFQDGGVSIGTVLVNNGTALLTTSSLSLGTHTITAVFSATTNFAASVISNALTQTVTTAGTTTATNANGSSAYGQSTTFTATVAGNNGATGMTGMVTFADGSTSIGTGTVGGGVATLAAVLIGLGSHTITALYASGDNNFFSSTSAPFTQTVVQAQTSTALTSSPASVVVDGTSLTFTATVTVNSTSTLSGTVTFLDGVTSLGTGLLNGTSGSSATFMTSALSAGKIHTITAVYNNNDSSDFRGSTASALAQTVLQITSMTAVTTSAPSSTVFGTSVTLTATVSGTSVTLPTGTVTFMDGTTAIGTGVLSNTTPDIATLSISTLSVGGVHTITARYSGDTLSAGSTSATVYRQTVTIATTTTTLTTTAPNPANGGQSLTYTATVTGLGGATGMTGNVTFEANGSPIGSLVPVANGVATLTTTSLTLQTTYTITAIYNGDNNFSGSTSASLFQTINMSGTTTTVISSAPAVVLNRSITLTATVSSGAGTPMRRHGDVPECRHSAWYGCPRQRHSYVDNRCAAGWHRLLHHRHFQRQRRLCRQHVGTF